MQCILQNIHFLHLKRFKFNIVGDKYKVKTWKTIPLKKERTEDYSIILLHPALV